MTRRSVCAICRGMNDSSRRLTFRLCARCENPGEHHVCAECVREHGLGKALLEGVGVPGQSTMGWNVCPDDVRTARAVMGEGE